MCLIQSSFCRGSPWDSEKLNDLPKVTHLISGQADVQIQVSISRPHTHDHPGTSSKFSLQVATSGRGCNSEWRCSWPHRDVTKTEQLFRSPFVFQTESSNTAQPGSHIRQKLRSTICRWVALFGELVMWLSSATLPPHHRVLTLELC